MAISDMIEEVQSSLKDIKRKYRFKKARMAHEEAAELQATLAKCRGKLEICRKDLNRAINTQSKNICAGLKEGADTLIQQQILWDAAIGYMLVRDAIYALETISSYDAVSHAYEMLDAAMKQVAGKKSGFPSNMKIGSTKERNAYGYITSSAALKEKEGMLDTFFEQLKLEGDIEARLAEARLPGERQAEQRHAYMNNVAPVSGTQSYMDRLSGVKDDEDMEMDFSGDKSAMFDIHPPQIDENEEA